MLCQKYVQRLHQLGFGIARGDVGGQGVEAQDVAQHAQEARVEQIAALREDSVQ